MHFFICFSLHCTKVNCNFVSDKFCFVSNTRSISPSLALSLPLSLFPYVECDNLQLKFDPQGGVGLWSMSLFAVCLIVAQGLVI